MGEVNLDRFGGAAAWDYWCACEDERREEYIKGMTCSDCVDFEKCPDERTDYGWCRFREEFVEGSEPIEDDDCYMFEKE